MGEQGMSGEEERRELWPFLVPALCLFFYDDDDDDDVRQGRGRKGREGCIGYKTNKKEPKEKGTERKKERKQASSTYIYLFIPGPAG